MNNQSSPSHCPFWPEPRLSPIAARDWLRDRIAAREPASLIRLGDGEFAVLGYGDMSPWSQTSQALHVWFGRDDFEPLLLEKLATQLRDAVRSATVVGLPRPSRQATDPFCAWVGTTFERFFLQTPAQIYTDCAVHRLWQMLLAYREILAGLPFLGIISSRDIGPHIGATFGVAHVEVYPVPSERSALGAFESIGSHFPQRFEQLCDTLTVPYRGAVFLVGAGALGKIYAEVIRQRGGIAIDVGSVLDGWASQATRGFLVQDPDQFSLQIYDRTAGWPAEQLVSRYRGLLRSVFYRLPPSDEEIAFYEQ